MPDDVANAPERIPGSGGVRRDTEEGAVESWLGSFYVRDRKDANDGSFTLNERIWVSINGLSVVRLATKKVFPDVMDAMLSPPGWSTYRDANSKLFGDTRRTLGSGAWRAQMNKLKHMPVGTFGKFMRFELLESITFFSARSWPGDRGAVDPMLRQRLSESEYYFMHFEDVRGSAWAGPDYLLSATSKETAFKLLAPLMPQRVSVVTE
jgi:hypothetical protein